MNDRAYYEKRALEEQEAAQAALCDEARRRHTQLAEAYLLRSRSVANVNV